MKNFIKIKCKLCGLELCHHLINRHLKVKHNWLDKNPSQRYYDCYIRKDNMNQGLCKICGKLTKFRSVIHGYLDHCSHECSNKNIDTKIKRKKTFIEKYKVEYVSLLDKTINNNKIINKNRTKEEWNVINNKRKQTRYEKYGDENYSLIGHQSYKDVLKKKYNDENYMMGGTESFKNMISSKINSGNNDPFNQKQAQISREKTCMIRYNVNNPSKDPKILKKALTNKFNKYGCFIPHSGKYSKISQIFFNRLSQFFCDLEYANHPKEYCFRCDLNFFFVDCICKEQKKIIEFNGDFWHANPKIFKKNSILNFPGKKMIAHDLWNLDKKRLDKIKNLGYEVFIVWENDVMKNFNNMIEGCKKFLNK